MKLKDESNMEVLSQEDIDYLIIGVEDGWLYADKETLKLYYYYKERNE